MVSDYLNELKVYESSPEKYIKTILPGRLERDLICSQKQSRVNWILRI